MKYKDILKGYCFDGLTAIQVKAFKLLVRLYGEEQAMYIVSDFLNCYLIAEDNINLRFCICTQPRKFFYKQKERSNGESI